MKPIIDFAVRVGAKVSLPANLVVKRENRYFLLSDGLKKIVHRDFYYAGLYLGKVKEGKVFPSFPLLAILAKKESNKIVVDSRTAWLFICGRDIFRNGIVTVRRSRKEGSYTLVLNEHEECLGFGKIICNLDKECAGAVVKNISDIGDFLRREA
jgi:ribosome biogenesis protein Nip4